jgi:hypothetical protein
MRRRNPSIRGTLMRTQGHIVCIGAAEGGADPNVQL